MKISILQKFLIFALIILAGNGYISYAVYTSNQKLQDTEHWVQHSGEVISQSADILSLITDIETAARGFVLTNDSTFLEPLFAAEKIIFTNIGQLRKLVQDNPKQQQLVDSANYYIQKRLAFSMQQVELRSTQGLTSAIAFISTNRGKYFSDRIRQFTSAIQHNESTLLEQRKQTNKNSMAVFNQTSIVLFYSMTIFTILLLFITGKYLQQNKEKEEREAELIVTSQKLVFQSEEKEKQENANKELEAFSYSISHDLRAPLRHIGGFVDLLIKNNSTQLDESGMRYLNIISESSHEMGKLIDALLTFSKLSRTELQRTLINSQDMVTQVIKSFDDELAGRNVELNVNKLPDVTGDETLIRQVWFNLISNAIKYSGNVQKAVIDIGCKNENDKKVFYVKDNGAGFDMNYADKLFGVFQRLHKARDFEGIGIGLANVNRIIIRHGGKCWAESEVDKGATFYFSIPNN